MHDEYASRIELMQIFQAQMREENGLANVETKLKKLDPEAAAKVREAFIQVNAENPDWADQMIRGLPSLRELLPAKFESPSVPGR